MGKKMMKRADAKQEKGFRQVNDGFSPFWESKPGDVLIGVWNGERRTLKGTKGYAPQDVVELIDEQTNEAVTVSLKGNLLRLWNRAAIGSGETVRIHHIEKMTPEQAGNSTGMHRFDLQVKVAG